MKNKIAVVEDNLEVREMVTKHLEQSGYVVQMINDGKEAVNLIPQINPDLIVMDWNLPFLSGIEVCKFLRERRSTSNIPIIMITIYDLIHQKVSALESGVDDYMTKPINILELISRVSALIRRSKPREYVKEIEFESIVMNLTTHIVTVKKREILLRPKEFELLRVLLQSPGRTLTRKHLLERVWGYNQNFTGRTIDSHIKHIRKKLGIPASKMIKTVVGYGYKLEK